jgi:tetrahydromethanopterin S-methyltransferase subunit G
MGNFRKTFASAKTTDRALEYGLVIGLIALVLIACLVATLEKPTQF